MLFPEQAASLTNADPGKLTDSNSVFFRQSETIESKELP